MEIKDCVKCGAMSPENGMWHEIEYKHAVLDVSNSPDYPEDGAFLEKEYLRITCWNCRYGWNMPCLDAEK